MGDLALAAAAVTDCRAIRQRSVELPAAGRATAALLLATMAVAALIAAVPGAPAQLRDAFAFSLKPGRGGSADEAVTYFVTNARVVGALLLAAWARSRIAAGVLLDAPVAVVVAGNVVFVGMALGAYGSSAAPWLLHLPLEWATLGLASSAFVAGRTRPLSMRGTAATGGTASLLLAVAAVLEAWATP